MTSEHDPQSHERARRAPGQAMTAAADRAETARDGQGEGVPTQHGGMHDPDAMMRQHRRQTLWMYFANIMLVLWLLAGPAMLDYGSAGLAWSDIVSGALIVGFGVLALFPRGDFWGRWGICLVGIWLLFVPLVFAAPTGFAYANDTRVGALVIGLAVLALLLILGSVWAHEAWGSYWSWDPKETGALFTWLVYGVYLHVRTLRGWRGRRSAVFLALAFGTVVFTYFGNYWFGGLHAYSGV